MLKKGPPVDKGFMWCSKEGGPGLYWSKDEAEALTSLSDYVLEMGWESSGYSMMLRNIRNKMCCQLLVSLNSIKINISLYNDFFDNNIIISSANINFFTISVHKLQ